MKLCILAIGKKNDPGIADAILDFSARISHYAPLEWKLIPAGNSIEAESTAILKALEERDFVVILDERGKEIDSLGLSAILEKRLNEGTHRLVFVIGGAFGVTEAVREKGQVISLSKLTFPHQLVRLILAEQIYRAFSILKGERYHHA